MKILIVEDEEMIREGISDYLTDCGYETIEAADGQEALEQFSSYEVALVLLDIQMPKLNGLEVLSEIRKTSQVPVLMLTAFQDEEYKMSAFASLADGYLEKPFSLIASCPNRLVLRDCGTVFCSGSGDACGTVLSKCLIS